MNRSKLFLEVAACSLSIVGFVASKAKWTGVPTAYRSAFGSCIRVSQLGSITSNGNLRLETSIVIGIGLPIRKTYFPFTNVFAGVCLNAAYPASFWTILQLKEWFKIVFPMSQQLNNKTFRISLILKYCAHNQGYPKTCKRVGNSY